MNTRNINSVVYSCNKIQFRNESRALAEMVKINDIPGHTRKITNVYKCKICRTWHLTSMDPQRHIAIVKFREIREASVNPSDDVITNRLRFLLSKNKMK